MTTPTVCALGPLAVQVWTGDPAVLVLDGHGVEVFWNSTVEEAAELHARWVPHGLGQLFLSCQTIVDHAGGVGVPDGSVLLHDAEICSQGLGRAAS